MKNERQLARRLEARIQVDLFTFLSHSLSLYTPSLHFSLGFLSMMVVFLYSESCVRAAEGGGGEFCKNKKRTL